MIRPGADDRADERVGVEERARVELILSVAPRAGRGLPEQAASHLLSLEGEVHRLLLGELLAGGGLLLFEELEGMLAGKATHLFEPTGTSAARGLPLRSMTNSSCRSATRS